MKLRCIHDLWPLKPDHCLTKVCHAPWFPSLENPEKSSEREVTVRLLDVNDNFPVLIEKQAFICVKKPEPVIIKAQDADSEPFSQPFTFSMGNKKSSNWDLQSIDGMPTYCTTSDMSEDGVKLKGCAVRSLHSSCFPMCVMQLHQLNWSWRESQRKIEPSHLQLPLKTMQGWEPNTRLKVS